MCAAVLAVSGPIQKQDLADVVAERFNDVHEAHFGYRDLSAVSEDGQFHRSVHGSGHDDRCQHKHQPMEVPACQAHRWRCVSARRSSAL